jgi:hypothetical protein
LKNDDKVFDGSVRIAIIVVIGKRRTDRKKAEGGCRGKRYSPSKKMMHIEFLLGILSSEQQSESQWIHSLLNRASTRSASQPISPR